MIYKFILDLTQPRELQAMKQTLLSLIFYLAL